MEIQGDNNVIHKYRKARAVIKLTPFIFVFFYLISFIIYPFATDAIIEIMDISFYTSPLQVLFLLILSNIFNLCKWHKTACILPLTSIFAICIDRYAYSLIEIESMLNVITLIIVFSTTLISAYFVFLHPKKDD